MHLDIKYYHSEGLAHNVWMDKVMEDADTDIVGFFDIDCVPTNTNIVEKCVQYVSNTNNFIGIAQTTNHIKPGYHVYAGPAFFFISKQTYFDRLGKPSFSETYRSDVGEELSYVAEEKDVEYKCLYPSYFEKSSHEGGWRLGNYGYFGIGTYFDCGIYHLYQGRFNYYTEFFEKRCDQILNGYFDTTNMQTCKVF